MILPGKDLLPGKVFLDSNPVRLTPQPISVSYRPYICLLVDNELQYARARENAGGQRLLRSVLRATGANSEHGLGCAQSGERQYDGLPSATAHLRESSRGGRQRQP